MTVKPQTGLITVRLKEVDVLSRLILLRPQGPISSNVGHLASYPAW